MPGTPEFALAYANACKRAVEVKQATFRDLIGNYFSSASFANLGERTRADYQKHRPIIEEVWHKLPLEVLKDKRIKAIFGNGAMPWQGRRVPASRFDFCHMPPHRLVWRDDGLLKVNRLLTIEGAHKADRSDMIWLPEHIEAFWKTASQGMELALILPLNLGRREGDLIRLTWGDYTGEFMHVRTPKGRRKLNSQRASPRLSVLLWMLTGCRSGAFLTEDEPSPQRQPARLEQEGHFSTKLARPRIRPGCATSTFTLRGTAVTILAENGLQGRRSHPSGHSMKQVEGILEKYMARTRALNDAATKKLEQSWIAQFALG